jgi:hypothetical protein
LGLQHPFRRGTLACERERKHTYLRRRVAL